MVVSQHALQQGGMLSQHALQQGVVWSRGVPGPGSLLPEGCLVWRASAPRWGVPGHQRLTFTSGSLFHHWQSCWWSLLSIQFIKLSGKIFFNLS